MIGLQYMVGNQEEKENIDIQRHPAQDKKRPATSKLLKRTTDFPYPTPSHFIYSF